MVRFGCLALLLILIGPSSAVPSIMRAIRKTGISGCGPPLFSCVSLVNETTPEPGFMEVLIRVSGTGINPDELSILKIPLVHYTLGIDVAGVVVAIGRGCSGRLKVGDRVWGPGIAGGMGEYAVRLEATLGILPPGREPLDLVGAGTLPTVAMTSLGALRSAGAPWAEGGNITVLITAGTGGVGYTAVQLAKIMGASRVITAASGDGIAFAKSLGADLVVDYHKSSVFDAVQDHSVDVVISNHKSNMSAVRSMEKLKANGGVYVTLDGDISGNWPPGMRHVDYDLFDPKEAIQCVFYLDTLAKFLADGKMRMLVQQTFGFEHARDALNIEAQGHVHSKVAVSPVINSEVLV